MAAMKFSALRNPNERWLMDLILLFMPSTAPLETRCLVHDRIPSRWVRSMRTNFLKGSNRDLIAECIDRKSTRLNSSHRCISYAVFCLKKIDRRSDNHSAGRASCTACLACTSAPLCVPPGGHGFLFPARLFFKDTATHQNFTLSLHDPFPI